ncbi:hypothetical protein DFH08DRAFT_822347 [Mycena albidolilacea]|uniref:Uncharacterized protein n=1 Tax=Mycena albidolilacea TaxID=1033008 RepID=A0AAD6Z8G1_9AGAR|nr:hypothetical protein DFH08DRAFT_822347 [Mycena albidolilacea]
MQSFFLLLAAVLGASAAVAPHAPLVINTPVSAAQCEPLLITWSGGIPPYVMAVQINPIQPLPISGTDVTTDTSFTWIVNATLGQSLVLLVTDEENGSLHTVSSAPFTVIPGGASFVGLDLLIR